MSWTYSERVMRRRSIRPLPHDVLIDLHLLCCGRGLGWFWEYGDTLVIRSLARARLNAGLSVASSWASKVDFVAPVPSLSGPGASLYTLAWMPPHMCRMMGVVNRGSVYYDLFQEFAGLAT